MEPLAGLSSASACIDLKYLDQYTFKPVYTHQCFENEFIPGFAPMEEDELLAQDIARKSEELCVSLVASINQTIVVY